MARFYAILTKIVLPLGVAAVIYARYKNHIDTTWTVGLLIVLVLTCFPGLVINDLQKQIDSLKHMSSKKTEARANSQGKDQESSVWVCTKCGTTNPVGTRLCSNCHS